MEKSQKEAQKKVSGSGIGNSRAIEIDDNIPVPSYYKPRGKGNRKYPWNEMEINQSFFVPDMKVRRFSSQVQLACKKYKKRFIVRDWKCDDGVEGVRVWRIE